MTKAELERVAWWLRDTAATIHRSHSMADKGRLVWPAADGAKEQGNWRELSRLAYLVERMAERTRRADR